MGGWDIEDGAEASAVFVAPSTTQRVSVQGGPSGSFRLRVKYGVSIWKWNDGRRGSYQTSTSL